MSPGTVDFRSGDCLVGEAGSGQVCLRVEAAVGKDGERNKLLSTLVRAAEEDESADRKVLRGLLQNTSCPWTGV